MQFTLHNPTQIHFGAGMLKKLSKLIDPTLKVLVLYGGGSIKKNGIYAQIHQALDGRNWVEFGGIEPNPTIEILDQAVAISRQENIDFILAVGGGSVIDGAKYVAAASLYRGAGWDILQGTHRVTEAIPLGVVLTLPATGSESNAGAVISRQATQEKFVFAARAVRPSFAVLDPEVMKSLPERQLANGIVDAFIHVCEQYLTYPVNAWVQDGYAEVLLRSLSKLAEQFDQRDDDVWRENLMWSTNQALAGLIGAGVPHDWSTHMIGHEITALYGVDHARSLALIQPSVLRANIEQKRAKLEQMGENVFSLESGCDLAERTIERIERLYQKIGIATRLSDTNIITESAHESIISALKAHHQPLALGEHKNLSETQIRNILKNAC